MRAVLEPDQNGARARKAGFAEQEIKIGSFYDARLAAVAKAVNNVALTLANANQVNGDAASADAVIRATPRKIGDAPARHHRLGGRAAFIHAGSADVCALHERRAPSGIGQGLAQRRAPLARADDDGLVVIRCAHEWSSGR